MHLAPIRQTIPHGLILPLISPPITRKHQVINLRYITIPRYTIPKISTITGSSMNDYSEQPLVV